MRRNMRTLLVHQNSFVMYFGPVVGLFVLINSSFGKFHLALVFNLTLTANFGI